MLIVSGKQQDKESTTKSYSNSAKPVSDIQRSKKKKVLCVVVLAVGTAACAFFFRGKLRYIASPTPILDSSQIDLMVQRTQSSYDRGTSQIMQARAAWDDQALVTSASVRFGGTRNQLIKLYQAEQPSPWFSFTLYSPKFQTSRLYEGSQPLNPRDEGVDLSSYGPTYQNTPATLVTPQAPQSAIAACLKYAETQGEYLLYECSNTLFDHSQSRGWVCTFVDSAQAAEVEWLFQLLFLKDNKSKLCSYDEQSATVTSWRDMPPPMN